MIYVLFGHAAAGKDELFRQAHELAPGRVSRVALGDELKRQADDICRARHGISAFTQDPEQKRIIRPLLERYGQVHGPALVAGVVAAAQALEEHGQVVFNTRIQNAAEMAPWLDIGAQPVWVTRPGVGPATDQEREDVLGMLGCGPLNAGAGDLEGVRDNARHLLFLAGVLT